MLAPVSLDLKHISQEYFHMHPHISVSVKKIAKKIQEFKTIEQKIFSFKNIKSTYYFFLFGIYFNNGLYLYLHENNAWFHDWKVLNCTGHDQA